jgi:hypothetical protein
MDDKGRENRRVSTLKEKVLGIARTIWSICITEQASRTNWICMDGTKIIILSNTRDCADSYIILGQLGTVGEPSRCDDQPQRSAIKVVGKYHSPAAYNVV